MATQTCGKTTVTYDDSCSYSCSCLPTSGCKWSVSCPGKGGQIVTSGTGLIRLPGGRVPTVTVAGQLEVCAKMLAKAWRRPVIVPPALRGKRIRLRTYKGTLEEIAAKLGLQLGSRRKR